MATEIASISSHPVRLGYITKLEADPSNPSLIAYQIFQKRGYALDFLISGLNVEVVCVDGLQRSQLEVRMNIMARHPNFRFFDLAFSGNNLGIVEKAANGDRTGAEVQRYIPGAELISLAELDIKGGLVLAYNRTELFFERYQKQRLSELADSRSLTHRTNEWDVRMQGIVGRAGDSDREMVRAGRRRLDVEPISPERISVIVSSLVDKTEAFLTT